MIPKECQLDIFVRESSPETVQIVETLLASVAKLAPLKVLGFGYALTYKNIMAAADPQTVREITAELTKHDGVYVNEYPPEILAEMPE